MNFLRHLSHRHLLSRFLGFSVSRLLGLQTPSLTSSEHRRLFSSTPVFTQAVGVGHGASSGKIKVFAMVDGRPGIVEVSLAVDMTIAYLAEEIIKKLRSLPTVDPSIMTLHTAELDDKDQVINVNKEALPARKSLAEVKLASGMTVIVKLAGTAAVLASPVIASKSLAFPPLPPAMEFSTVLLSGETWLEATVPEDGMGVTVSTPFFFTEEQIELLRAFIRNKPTSRVTQALMLVGTIKCGKTTLLEKILPRLIAAEFASPRREAGRLRPVIFHFAFTPGSDAETAAMELCDALESFALTINVEFNKPSCSRAALNNLPTILGSFCERVRKGGGEPWLLLDEMQGPGLCSTPTEAAKFTAKFKKVRNTSVMCCRVVDQGGTLVAGAGAMLLE